MGETALAEIIRAELRARGPLTFARYMELALYHPTLGYYSGGPEGREPVGWTGDFFTSGDISPLWGWAIARQLHQMWQVMGRPARFDVIEPGAGRGLLAASVWRYAIALDAAWATALRYTLLDRAPASSPLRARRERRLADELARIPAPAEGVRWLGSLREVTGGQAGALTGCVVSNELVDALPVHIVEKRGDRLAEVYIGLGDDGESLVERLGAPSSDEVATYLDSQNVPWRRPLYPEGWRAEVCLAAGDWIDSVADALGRGFVLTIDYGDTARRLYTRERLRGTLLAYRGHHVNLDPLDAPGAQDLTAHVNFSALIQTGRTRGLHARLTTQEAFLRGLGVHEEALALAERAFPYARTERHTDRGQADYLRRAALLNAVATLLDPNGLGGFRVLIQWRGATGPGRALLGLGGGIPG